MARTYVRPGSSVTVEPEPGRVIVVSRDGNHAPVVRRCPVSDPGAVAEGIGRDLIEDGYTLAA